MQMLLQVKDNSPGDVLLCPQLMFVKLQQAAARYSLQLPLKSYGFEFSANNCALYWELINDFLQRRKAHHAFVLVLRRAPITPQENYSAIQEQLLRLQLWCRDHQACLVFINCGKQSSAELRLQRALESYLIGIASLQPECSQRHLHIHHWRTSHQHIVQQYYTLTVGADNFFHALKNPSQQEQFGDDSLMYANSSRLSTLFADEYSFNVVDSVETLYQYGLRHGSCWLIFELSHESEILPVVRIVYQLRRQNGIQLKIIVTLNQLHLRSHTEQIILKSGANLLFEANATPGYIRNVMLTQQHAVFSGDLPFTFRTIENSIKLLTITVHILLPAEFAAIVHSVMQPDSSFLHDSVLLRLTPRPDVSLKQAFEQFNPQRRGDLGTATNDCAYIFLLGVNNTKMDLVLQHIFALPPQLLFAKQEVLNDANDINQALETLTAHTGTSWLPRLMERNVKRQHKFSQTLHQHTTLRHFDAPQWIKLG